MTKKVRKAIINYCISFALIILVFIVATLTHKLDVTGGNVISEQTQVLFIPTNSGLVYYAVALVTVIISSFFGRRTNGIPATGLLSFALVLVRVVACFAMISAGASLYLFEGKAMQIMQLVFPFLCFVFYGWFKNSDE